MMEATMQQTNFDMEINLLISQLQPTSSMYENMLLENQEEKEDENSNQLVSTKVKTKLAKIDRYIADIVYELWYEKDTLITNL